VVHVESTTQVVAFFCVGLWVSEPGRLGGTITTLLVCEEVRGISLVAAAAEA
jgi:hypothetical protein